MLYFVSKDFILIFYFTYLGSTELIKLEREFSQDMVHGLRFGTSKAIKCMITLQNFIQIIYNFTVP